MARLPSGIKKIELDGRENGRQQVRYIVTVDVGTTAERKQKQKRFKTEAEARKWQSDTQSEVKNGKYILPQKLTVEQACADWLASLHNIEESTLRSYKIWLAPLWELHGHVELQRLTKTQLDDVVALLRAGEFPGREKPWKARTVNGMLWAISAVMEERVKQGHLALNVGKMVARVASDKLEMQTLDEPTMYKVMDFPDRDRHLWGLALYMGLRRGEIAGLTWKNVDFEKRSIEIIETRICVGKQIITKKPKSLRSKRILPMSDEVYDLLLDAHGRVESVYVACDKRGNEYHPNYITERWEQMLKAAGVPYVKLHEARHTCASLMSFKGVPIAVVSKWLGHSTVTITASTYLHSQDEQLKQASTVFGRNNV